MRSASFLLGVFITFTAYSQETGIEFKTGSWENIQAAAKEAGKPIFVYGSSEHCGPCRVMEAKVFPEKKVGDYYNTTFINYKVNLEEGQGLELAQKYHVDRFPTYFYFDKDGRFLHISGGGKPAADFIQDGENAFDPGKAYATLKNRYYTGERTPGLLYSFSEAIKYSNISDDLFSKVSTEYLNTQNEASLKSKENLVFIFNNAYEFDDLTTSYYFKFYNAFASIFDEAALDEKNTIIIRNAATKAGEDNNGIKLKKIQDIIHASMGSQAEMWSSFARVKYLLGTFTKDHDQWTSYAEAAISYGKVYPLKAAVILHEVAVYFLYYGQNKKTLQKASQIIAQAITTNRSYDNVLLQAKIFQKLGEEKKATEAAYAAISLTDKKGSEYQEVSEFLEEIKAGKKQ